jgi:two-component system, OmpR family, response regulator
MPDDRARVLVVDDEQMQLHLVERLLRGDGFDVMTCSSPIGVSNVVRSYAPHIVLLDVNIPALSGDRLLGIARKAAPASTLFILYSASDDAHLRKLAKEVEADGWISKSVTGGELSTRLRQLLRSNGGAPGSGAPRSLFFWPRRPSQGRVCRTDFRSSFRIRDLPFSNAPTPSCSLPRGPHPPRSLRGR